MDHFRFFFNFSDERTDLHVTLFASLDKIFPQCLYREVPHSERKRFFVSLLTTTDICSCYCSFFFSLRGGPHYERRRTRISPSAGRFETSREEVHRGSCTNSARPLADLSPTRICLGPHTFPRTRKRSRRSANSFSYAVN